MGCTALQLQATTVGGAGAIRRLLRRTRLPLRTQGSTERLAEARIDYMSHIPYLARQSAKHLNVC
jgi:hypothetical protein